MTGFESLYQLSHNHCPFVEETYTANYLYLFRCLYRFYWCKKF